MIVAESEADGLMSRLADEHVPSYIAENKTIFEIVTGLLAFQVLPAAARITVIADDIDPVVSRSISVTGDTILKALYRLRDTVGGFIYVDENRALQWKTSIGEDKGQQIRYKKNIKGITRNIDYTTLANKLYAYGAGEGDARIKLSDVESALASNASSGQKDVVVADASLFEEGIAVTISDDAASESNTIDTIAGNTLTMTTNLANTYTTAASAKVNRSNDYLEDTDSQTEWGGIYIKLIVDKSITHPDTLLEWVKLRLADLKEPLIAYRIDAVDLSASEETDFSFEALQIGSTIKAIDEDLGIDVSAQVVKLIHPDLSHPEQMRIEIANRTKDITDTLAEVYDAQQLAQHIATRIGAGQVIVLGEFTVKDWVTGGATTIVGSNIETGTITADILNANVLVASNILIDGAIYLSGWRKDGDLTKFDGAIISTGTIDKTGLNFSAFEVGVDTLDDIGDGANYSRINTVDITAGSIKLSSVIQSSSYRTSTDVEKSNWDGKIITFYQDEPPTAEAAGDLWVDTNDKNKLYRWSGSAWTTVRDTDIVQALADAASAQSTADSKPDDMDEIGEGVTYERVLATDISAGHIKLSSVTVIDSEWYNESGVEIDATHGINIYGVNNAFTTRATKTGTIQCYVGADGKIYAGGGAVYLDSDGVSIKGEYLSIYNDANAIIAEISESSERLWINVYGATQRGIYMTSDSNEGISICADAVAVPTANDLRLIADVDVFIEGELGNVVIWAGGKIILEDQVESEDINPETSTKDIGDLTDWDEIHCDTLFYNGGTWPDIFDDLALIRKIRNRLDDETKLDMDTVPDILKVHDKVAYMARMRGKEEDGDNKKLNRIMYRIAGMETEVEEHNLRIKKLKTRRKGMPISDHKIVDRGITKAERHKLVVQGYIKRAHDAIGNLDSDMNDRMSRREDRFYEISKKAISVGPAISLSLGALKQVADKLDSIENRLSALEG